MDYEDDEDDTVSVELPLPGSPGNDTVSTVGPTFYQTLQDEIQALRSKVDQQLSDIITSGTGEVQNLSNKLLDVKETKPISSGQKSRPLSPGSLRRQASPRNRARPQHQLISKHKHALQHTVSTPSSSGSSNLRAAVSNDITEPTDNLTRTANTRRRSRALLDSSVSSASSSSVSTAADLPVNPTSSSLVSNRALASPSWGARMRNTEARGRNNAPAESDSATELGQIQEEEEEEGYSSAVEGISERKELNDDHHSSPSSTAIVMTKASPTRRAAAYEQYRNVDHRRPWRQQKKQAAKSTTFNPYKWDAENRGDSADPSKEDESELIQLLSEDTSTVNALSGQENPTSTTSTQNHEETTAFESDMREKKIRQNRKFFPEEEEAKGDADDQERHQLYPQNQFNTESNKTASSPEQDEEGEHHANLYDFPQVSNVSELTSDVVLSMDDSSSQRADRSNSPEANSAKAQRQHFDPLSERNRTAQQRSVMELAMNPKNRDAPANEIPALKSRPDAPSDDADNERLNSEAAISRPDAPSGGKPLTMSACSGIGNDYTLPSGSWTYSSSIAKPDLSGQVVTSTDGSVPSALTESGSHASKQDALAVAEPTGVYPGAPARNEEKKEEETAIVLRSDFQEEKETAIVPRSDEQEEEEKKEEEESAVSVRKDGHVVRLENVDGKTIRDPYGDYGVFTGILLGGQPHGQGSMTYADGRTYIGEWKQGRWNGQGRTTFTNGDIYTGQYKMDKRHGVGRYQWTDGRIYDGDFVNDQREGKGTYSFPDGSAYTGGFRAGIRHGQGCYRFSDSSVYNGEFKDGKYHGIGECLWSDGRCYRGEWKDGRTHGYGVEMRADGTIRHEGEWREDRPLRKKKKKKKKDPPELNRTRDSNPVAASFKEESVPRARASRSNKSDHGRGKTESSTKSENKDASAKGSNKTDSIQTKTHSSTKTDNGGPKTKKITSGNDEVEVIVLIDEEDEETHRRTRSPDPPSRSDSNYEIPRHEKGHFVKEEDCPGNKYSLDHEPHWSRKFRRTKKKASGTKRTLIRD